jgi:signal transduction histidine kinase
VRSHAGTPGVGTNGAPWIRGVSRRDVAIAAVVGVLQIAGTALAASHQTSRHSLDALAYALLAIGPVALIARRRLPVTVYGIVFASTLAYWAGGYRRGPIFFALIVAFAQVVWEGRHALAVATIAAGWASFLWLPDLVGNGSAPTLAGMLGLAAWLLVLLAASELVRSRKLRSMQAARVAAEEQRRRASEERLRIARELHDVLAHNIAVINVQAGVALHLGQELPSQARDALSTIKAASKDALGELRWALDVLRQGVDDASDGGAEAGPAERRRSPLPGLDQLDALVERASLPGVEVRRDIEGTPRAVGKGVETAAYRVVQEALTNVARHAGSAHACVRLVYERDALWVQVDDDGRGPGGHNGRGGSGSGIAGMRERVEALGGDLEAGPRPGGGFRVRARFPTGVR